jgi:hypothetical protein
VANPPADEMEMFREKVFELSQNLAFIATVWGQVRVIAKARSGVVFVPPNQSRFNIDSYRAEMNQKLSRGYIQPMANNR